jgi:hypothetical protein
MCYVNYTAATMLFGKQSRSSPTARSCRTEYVSSTAKTWGRSCDISLPDFHASRGGLKEET